MRGLVEIDSRYEGIELSRTVQPSLGSSTVVPRSAGAHPRRCQVSESKVAELVPREVDIPLEDEAGHLVTL